MVARATDKEFLENFGTDIVHNLKECKKEYTSFNCEETENLNYKVNGE